MSAELEGKYLCDPYLDWAGGEGVPVAEGLWLDLLKIETRPWARFGVDGAIGHVTGRGDFMALFVLDLPPGATSDPQQHLYEEVIYVLSGHGSTTVEHPDGTSHSFEWGPKSLFALPLNTRYRHFNGSGRERARLVAGTNAPMIMNVFHNQDFIFNNGYAFAERFGPSAHYDGDGDFLPVKPGRHMWETNFVPDLSSFKLQFWAERGAGGSSLVFSLADGVMHAHCSEMPVGTYKKGHRHGPDFHVFCVNGTGYSLLWYDFSEKVERVDWQHGVVFSPPDQMFHQHFNTAPTPARYLAIAVGSQRYPLVESKRKLMDSGVDTSVAQGGNQIEYEDQDPRIHALYLDELARHGGQSKMGRFIDESAYLHPADREA